MQARIAELPEGTRKRTMQQLLDLDFTDYDKCMSVCAKHKDNVEAVVNELF